MDGSIIFMFAGILILGALFLTIICLNKKGVKHLNVEHYRTKCLEIEHQLKRDELSSYSMCVINADKLVDQALRERGIKGQTMAERMKNSASVFSDRNGIWKAHILRNKISHEVNFQVSYDDALHALASFRKALKDIGAI